MLFLFVILYPDCVSPNDYIIVVGVFGELGVLACNLHVESGGILDWEGFEVEFAEDVDVLTVDLAHSDFQDLLLCVAHIQSTCY